MSGKRVFAALTAAILLLAVFSSFALAEAPNIVTLDPVVTGSSALLKSLVLSNGGQPITESGFYYGTSRAALSQRVQAQYPDAPEYTLTPLTPGTTYYYQAYAVNASGESVGEVVQFKAGPSATAKPAGPPSDIQGYIDRIQSEFGIQIHYKTKRPEWNNELSYTLVSSDAEALSGLKIIYAALSRYPNGFIEKLNLRYIALASEIARNDGTAALGANRSNSQQSLMLIKATTTEATVHHELFHAFEAAFGLRFADWDKANIRSGLYDEDLRTNYDLIPPGFIERHSLLLPEEDRADLFMYMMTDSLKGELLDAAGHDKYLKDKIRRLNNSLSTNLGKAAQNAKWSATAAAAAGATPKTMGTVVPAAGAKLYDGPDTQIFSAVMGAPAAELSVVQSGSRWLKVLYGADAYYMLASDAGAPASAAPPASEPLAPVNTAPVVEATVPAENIYGVADRLSQKYGINVSVNDTLTLYDDLVAGAVRDTRGAAALAAEYEALLESGAKTPPNVKDLVICRTITIGGSAQGAAMDGSGSVLYLSQRAAGQLSTVMEALVAQL